MLLGSKKPFFRPAHDCEEPDSGDLDEQFQMLRKDIYSNAERPDSFWEGRHKAIMAKLQKHQGPWAEPILKVWVPAAAMVLVCLFFFGKSREMPVPDMAGGYDQNLLLEVERTLKQDFPDAFAPAAIITSEIERAKGKGGHHK